MKEIVVLQCKSPNCGRMFAVFLNENEDMGKPCGDWHYIDLGEEIMRGEQHLHEICCPECRRMGLNRKRKLSRDLQKVLT